VPDVERFRLRHFVDGLRGTGELVVHDENVPLAAVASRLDGERRAVLLTSTGPERAALAGNVMGARTRLAAALGVTVAEVLPEALRRSSSRIAPVEVSTEAAPVHEVVALGAEVDLTSLPVHVQHERDGAPFISAALDITRKTTDGWFNVGCRRLMLRGPRETGIDLNAPSDLRVRYQLAAQRGERLPIAFAIGSHPLDYIASGTLTAPTDELAVLGALRTEPVPVVRAVSQDLLVPADAELVIEGYLDPAGYVHREGPYGEYLGYYGHTKLNPVFRATALTRRRDALFQTATISGRHLARTDTAQLVALATETGVWNALNLAVREPRAVYVHPASGGMFNVRIAITSHFPGESRNAIAAAFGAKADVKNVFVVDDDIDVFADEQIEWALATRFQADRDFVVASGFRAVPLDPSLPAFGAPGAKAGFDLTVGPAANRGEGGLPGPPRPAADPPTATSVRDALASGAKTFAELMRALADDDGRGLVRELHHLVEGGHAELRDDGRWAAAVTEETRGTTPC
jgi:2,5-furandicarboxylate decarboxylase 1